MSHSVGDGNSHLLALERRLRSQMLNKAKGVVGGGGIGVPNDPCEMRLKAGLRCRVGKCKVVGNHPVTVDTLLFTSMGGYVFSASFFFLVQPLTLHTPPPPCPPPPPRAHWKGQELT